MCAESDQDDDAQDHDQPIVQAPRNDGANHGLANLIEEVRTGKKKAQDQYLGHSKQGHPYTSAAR